MNHSVYKTIAGTENRIFGDAIKKRASLKKAIEDHGFEQVMEETAYTWFNRLMALRFMDANDYQPIGIRVVTPKDGYTLPEILDEAKSGTVD